MRGPILLILLALVRMPHCPWDRRLLQNNEDLIGHVYNGADPLRTGGDLSTFVDELNDELTQVRPVEMQTWTGLVGELGADQNVSAGLFPLIC